MYIIPKSCCLSSGSPLIAWACFNKANVNVITGSITRYESSKGIYRGFCSNCGSTLTYNRASGDSDNEELNARNDEIFISISTMDNPELFPPEEHIRCTEKVNWLHTNDDLPHYENFSVNFKEHQHQQSSVK